MVCIYYHNLILIINLFAIYLVIAVVNECFITGLQTQPDPQFFLNDRLLNLSPQLFLSNKLLHSNISINNIRDPVKTCLQLNLNSHSVKRCFSFISTGKTLKALINNIGNNLSHQIMRIKVM